jgi:hypothetical protein
MGNELLMAPGDAESRALVPVQIAAAVCGRF